jgi:hypothetical protein
MDKKKIDNLFIGVHLRNIVALRNNDVNSHTETGPSDGPRKRFERQMLQVLILLLEFGYFVHMFCVYRAYDFMSRPKFVMDDGGQQKKWLDVGHIKNYTHMFKRMNE